MENKATCENRFNAAAAIFETRRITAENAWKRRSRRRYVELIVSPEGVTKYRNLPFITGRKGPQAVSAKWSPPLKTTLAMRQNRTKRIRSLVAHPSF